VVVLSRYGIEGVCLASSFISSAERCWRLRHVLCLAQQQRGIDMLELREWLGPRPGRLLSYGVLGPSSERVA
jgi:hypothetical protein